MPPKDITPNWIEPPDGDYTDDPMVLLQELAILRQKAYAQHSFRQAAAREAKRRGTVVGKEGKA